MPLKRVRHVTAFSKSCRLLIPRSTGARAIRRQRHGGFNTAGRKALTLNLFDDSVVESRCTCIRFESLGPTVTNVEHRTTEHHSAAGRAMPFDHTASMSWKALYSATGIRVGSPTMRLILRLLQTRQTRSSLAILHGVSRSYPCRQVPRSGARHPGAASAKTSNPGPSPSHSRMELRRRHSAPAAVHRSGHCRSTRRQRISKKGNVIGNQRL